MTWPRKSLAVSLCLSLRLAGLPGAGGAAQTTAPAWQAFFTARPISRAALFPGLSLDLSAPRVRAAFIHVMAHAGIAPEAFAAAAEFQQGALLRQAAAGYARDAIERARQLSAPLTAAPGAPAQAAEDLEFLRRIFPAAPEELRQPLAELEAKVGSSCAFQALQALSQEPDYAAAKPVVLDGFPSRALRESPFDALRTTVMHGEKGLIDPTSRIVLVMFGGTGAKTAHFGIGASMGPIANKLLKLGGSPIAFQNPMYFQDQRPEEERWSVVDGYGIMRAQVDWMLSALGFVVARMPRDAEGRLTQSLWVGARSTGSGVLLQVLHEHILGSPAAGVLGDLSGALVMGLLGHSPAEVRDWIGLETSYLDSREGLADWPVHEKNASIFLPMGWAPAGESAPLPGSGLGPWPRVSMTLGANDPLSAPETQAAVAERFSRLHPMLDVSAVAMDTHHNPASSVSYQNRRGQTVKVRSMKRLGPFLEEILKPGPYVPGFHFRAEPDFWEVSTVKPELFERFVGPGKPGI